MIIWLKNLMEIRQLGVKEIKKWLTLYLMRDLSEDKPDLILWQKGGVIFYE